MDYRRFKLVATLKAGDVCVRSVAWFRDDNRLAASREDGSLQLWNGESRELKDAIVAHPDCAYAIALSPHAAIAASAGRDGSVRLWSVKGDKFAPETALLVNGPRTFSVLFSPDGRDLFAGSENGEIRQWEVKTRKLLRVLRVHKRSVESLALTSDGRRLVSAGGSENIAICWNTHSGEKTGVLKHGGVVQCVAISRDNDRIAIGGLDGIAAKWSWDGGQPTMSWANGTGIWGVSFSADGSVIATGGLDPVVKVWSTTSGELLAAIPVNARVYSVVFSRKGDCLATGDEAGNIKIWDFSRGE